MRFDDINLELIRCFVTVAECGSFTEAGERLHKSQSAISVRLKKLEVMLGRELLHRNSRSVALSSHGETFLPYARRLLNLNDEAIGVLQAPEISGQLRIGIVEYFAAHRLPELLAEIRRMYPAVDLQVRLGLSAALFRALDDKAVDVVIAKSDGTRSGGSHILNEPLHWACAADYATSALPEVLPLCLLPEPCSYRLHALSALQSSQREWREVITCASVLGLQTVISAGLGIGVVGASCLTPDMEVLDGQSGLPALPSIPLALFGPQKAKAQLIEPIVAQLCSVMPTHP